MILDTDAQGQSRESRERWSKECSAILKQAQLESGNNSRLHRAMADFNESQGEWKALGSA